MLEEEDIQVGVVYRYKSGIPKGCQGFHYRVRSKDVTHVPSYSKLVLVEAVDGPDAGMLFVCSPNNFCRRYVTEADWKEQA